MKLVLIADDDVDLSYLLELHIRSKGYETKTVTSLKETESFLTHKHPSMVLLDNHLDDGIGMEYVDRLKACSPGMPIVLMTADFGHDIRKSENYQCIDGLLLKPFTTESLNKILARLSE